MRKERARLGSYLCISRRGGWFKAWNVRYKSRRPWAQRSPLTRRLWWVCHSLTWDRFSISRGVSTVISSSAASVPCSSTASGFLKVSPVDLGDFSLLLQGLVKTSKLSNFLFLVEYLRRFDLKRHRTQNSARPFSIWSLKSSVLHHTP